MKDLKKVFFFRKKRVRTLFLFDCFSSLMGAFTLYNTPFGFQIYELNYCCVSMNSEENMAVLYILGQSILKRLFHVFHVLAKGKQIASPTTTTPPFTFE